MKSMITWLFAAIIVVASSGTADASRYRLWPLFSWESAADSSRLDLLGPLFSWQREGNRSAWVLRPLISMRRHSTVTRADVLYPLFSWEAGPGHSRTNLASFFIDDLRSYWHVGDPGPNSKQSATDTPRARVRDHSLQLRPLVFYRNRSDRGRSLSLLPIYGDFEGLLGFDKIRLAAFPLYLSVTRNLEVRRWYGFPFLSTINGPRASGTRLWPLAGKWEIDGKESSSYFLWPTWVKSTTIERDGTTQVSRVHWPLYASIDSPSRKHRAWLPLLGIPLFSVTEDYDERVRTVSAPWPLVMTQRDLDSGELLTTRLFPFWQTSKREGQHRSFYAWPLLRYRHEQNENGSRQSWSAFFVGGRHVTQKHADDPSAYHEATTVLGLVKDISGHGKRSGHSPALLEALFPFNSKVEVLYSPLWTLVAWQREEITQPLDIKLLWGIAGRRNGRWHGPIEFSTGNSKS